MSFLDADERARGFLRDDTDAEACTQWLDGLTDIDDPVVRGDVAARCGDDDAARDAYEQAWDRGGRGCALAYALLDARVRAGDELEALAVSRQALDADPCRQVVLLVSRFARSRDGSLAERAIALLRVPDPDDGEALGELVRLHVERGQADLSQAVCARAETLADATLDDACAVAADARGAQNEAERHLRQAVEREPSAGRWHNLGRFLLSHRRGSEAADALREAVSLAPTDYDALVDLGRALSRGCWTETQHVFRRAQALRPDRPEAWFYFGAAIDAAGCIGIDDARQAIEALDRFVELAGDRPDLAEAVDEVTRTCRADERERAWRQSCQAGMWVRLARTREILLECMRGMREEANQPSDPRPPMSCDLPASLGTESLTETP